MFCPYCGRELKDDERFCPQCGASSVNGKKPVSLDLSGVTGALGKLREQGSLRQDLLGNAKLPFVLTIAAQFLVLFLMGIDIGSLRLIYKGDDSWVQWIFDSVSRRYNISLFEDMGFVKFLLGAVHVAAVVMLLRPVVKCQEFSIRDLLPAIAAPAVELGWFVLMVLGCKSKAITEIADMLSRYSDNYISRSDMNAWFRVDLDLENEAWFFLVVNIAALALAVLTLRRLREEQERKARRLREQLEQAHRKERGLVGTDTSYAERLSRMVNKSNAACAPEGRSHVTCASCGHVQASGAAYCQNCYTPLIALKQEDK